MGDSTSLTWRAFCLPKKDHTPAEYEDAFAGAPKAGRFAIADGASESAFAGSWAQILVEAFVGTPGPWSAWLDQARERWRSKVQERDLPWYAENKFQEGAFAALLAIAITGGRWTAAAVGDCCLFQVRHDRLVRAFPLRRSCDFSNRPSLLGSRRRQADQPHARRIHVQGDLHPGDAVFLMTDALAQWFLEQVEQGHKPWTHLQAIDTDELFVRLVNQARQARELRNDDVTLVVIQAQSV